MIRKVCMRDAAGIAAIYNEYVEHTTISFETSAVSVSDMRSRIDLISKNYPFLVYELDGGIAGFCYAHPWKDRAAYVHTFEVTVYVSSSCRGRGIGTLLMQRLIGECRSTGCHVLIACITADNAGSICFHEKLGFCRVSMFSAVGRKFGRWLDVVDYELLLDKC